MTQEEASKLAELRGRLARLERETTSVKLEITVLMGEYGLTCCEAAIPDGCCWLPHRKVLVSEGCNPLVCGICTEPLEIRWWPSMGDPHA